MGRAEPVVNPINGRISVFLALFSLIGGLILLQMGRVQVMKSGQKLVQEFTNQFDNSKLVIYPERGKIYDRYGHLLAGNKPMYALNINPADVTNPETIARTLADIAGFDYQEVLAAASTPFDSENGPFYIPFSQRVGPEVIEKLEELDTEFSNQPTPKFFEKKVVPPSLNGLEWKVEWQRIYPEGNSAGNILGFVPYLNANIQDKAQPNIRIEGFYNMNPEQIPSVGVEGYYNRELSASPGEFVVPYDPNKLKELPTVEGGDDIILTIDRAIQHEMETILDNGVKTFKAESGTLLVLDPKTGEILAMATTPRLDPNQYWTLNETVPPPMKYNEAVSQPYEPGSVFKVITMAIGLDTGAVTANTEFVDTGEIEVGGITIQNWDRGAWGVQTMTGCLMHSLNVCLAWVATEIGSDRFYPYLKSFGIGRRSRIDLAGEEFSRLGIPGIDVTDANLGTNSFGQGLATTPVQLASAISAVANDGKIMAPHIVKAIVSDGKQRYIDPVEVAQPIKPETAHILTQMLTNSLEEETNRIDIEGYHVAGKTGTAEIYVPETGGYTTGLTNASFVGWGPSDDPRFLVYVWLEKPKVSPWGSMVAAPIFSNAANKLFEMMNIPPDDVRSQLQKK